VGQKSSAPTLIRLCRLASGRHTIESHWEPTTGSVALLPCDDHAVTLDAADLLRFESNDSYGRNRIIYWIHMGRAAVYTSLLTALLVVSVLLIADFPLLFAPPRSENEVVFRSEDNDISRDMAMDSQENIIIVGGRWEGLFESSKFHIVKASSSGQEVWTKTWNISYHDMLVGVEVDSLDNIVLAGITGANQDETTGLIIKLDSEGELIWQVEFPGIKYSWYWWPDYSDYFGLEIDRETDNIYLAGSLSVAGHQSLIAALNSSGAELWRTTWDGPSNSNGTDVTTMWLSSEEGIIVSGGIYEANGFDDYYSDFFIAAFDFNGTSRWNRTSSLIWTGLETNVDEYVTATASWKGYNQVSHYKYDSEGISSFELDVGEYYRITIQGFCLNGSEHILGFGRVESRISGSSVTRIFSARFEAPQATQTLILSCNSSGGLEWYDFLLLGEMSQPCGIEFDSEHRMIVAGHTSALSLYENDFFIVFGFRQTPFSPDYRMLLLSFFPLFNIIVPALMSELEKLHASGKSFIGIRSSGLKYKIAVWRLFQVQVLLLLFVLVPLVGLIFWGGMPIGYLPGWVGMFLLSLPIGILVLGVLYQVVTVREKRNTELPGDIEKDSYRQTRARPRSPSFVGTRGRCTACGESYRYPTHDISSEGTVRCLNCGHSFHLESTEELLKKLDTNREESRTDLEHDS